MKAYKKKVREYTTAKKSGKATVYKHDSSKSSKRKAVTKSHTGIVNGDAFSVSNSKVKKKSSGKEVTKTSKSFGVNSGSYTKRKTKSTTKPSGKVKSRTVTKTMSHPGGSSKRVVKNGVEKKYVARKYGKEIIKRKN